MVLNRKEGRQGSQRREKLVQKYEEKKNKKECGKCTESREGTGRRPGIGGHVDPKAYAGCSMWCLWYLVCLGLSCNCT